MNDSPKDPYQNPNTQNLYNNPIIQYFKASETSFYDGDTITFSWSTISADLVELTSYGQVQPSGSQSFQINHFTEPYITITLSATNTKLGQSVTQEITLKNKGNKPATEPKANNPATNKYTTTAPAKAKNYAETESFWSYKGRLRRRDYGYRLLGYIVISILLFFLNLMAIESTSADWSYIAFLMLTIFLFILILFQVIKRLQDSDRPGALAILSLIPIIGYIFMLFLVLEEGTKGSNKYGPDPKQANKNQ